MAKDKVMIPSVAPSKYANASQVIHSGPCIVKSVHVSSSSGTGHCLVYDGLNTSGKLKARIDTFANFGYTWRPGDGTDFDYGIYLVIDDTNTHVTVTFIPESRKAFI